MLSSPPARWLLLATSLAGRTASTVRVRLWRALKDLGVGSLRDGVALLPATADHQASLEAMAREVEAEGGTAWLLALPAQPPAVDDALVGLFDRGAEYAALLQTLSRLGAELHGLDEVAARRGLRQATKGLADIERVDFFPGPAREQARGAIAGLETVLNRQFSPEEPSARSNPIQHRDVSQFRGRCWATRRRPWVDRLASAWLIRRHIDPEATFVWLPTPADSRADWIGFDFDGAAFSHTDGKVTFETLLASFGLDGDPALARLGDLVHVLDVGGVPVPEAPGVEALLAGLRAGEPDDDRLLARASDLFDWLLRNYRERIRD